MRTPTIRTLITMAALAGATTAAGAQGRAVASACTGERVVSLIERMNGETAAPGALIGATTFGGCANVGLEQPRFLDAAPIAPVPLAPSVLSSFTAGGPVPGGAAGAMSTATDVNVVTNPEPSTVALCATGVAALAVVARRRRRG